MILFVISKKLADIGLYHYFWLYSFMNTLFIFVFFAAAQIYLADLGLKITKGRKWFIIGYITLFSLATICWLLDQFACSYVKTIK